LTIGHHFDLGLWKAASAAGVSWSTGGILAKGGEHPGACLRATTAAFAGDDAAGGSGRPRAMPHRDMEAGQAAHRRSARRAPTAGVPFGNREGVDRAGAQLRQHVGPWSIMMSISRPEDAHRRRRAAMGHNWNCDAGHLLKMPEMCNGLPTPRPPSPCRGWPSPGDQVWSLAGRSLRSRSATGR
jgi:hypothetical protein